MTSQKLLGGTTEDLPYTSLSVGQCGVTGEVLEPRSLRGLSADMRPWRESENCLENTSSLQTMPMEVNKLKEDRRHD